MFLYAIAFIAVYAHIKCPLYVQEPWFNIHKVIREKKRVTSLKKKIYEVVLFYFENGV